MRRIIREEEPAAPSTRINALGDTSVTVSADRQSDPSRLSRLIRGDLDWIVMKCLEKDRTRRYQTANGVAKDIQRYLNDEPVEAGPPSAAYRLRKFGRRYRHVLAVALAFVLLLVAAVTTLSIALVAVNQERREKERALDAEAKRRQQTRTALDAMSSQVIEEWLGKQSRFVAGSETIPRTGTGLLRGLRGGHRAGGRVAGRDSGAPTGV